MPESVVREKANSHTASSFGWELSLTNTRVDTPCDPGREEVACVSAAVSVGALISNSTRSP